MIPVDHRSRIAISLATLAALVLGAAGCATVPATRQASLVPTRHRIKAGPFLVATNKPLAPDADEVVALRDLEDQVAQTLGLQVDPDRDPIEVNILDDRETFNHFLTYYYADLPPRRAFFFAQGSRRVVYTYQGKHLEEDLRHEATHALLHASAPELPLWLDEGLAEFFEVPASRAGLHETHLTRLRHDLADGWQPDLRRLEGLTDVRQMTPRDYREAWAWTHYLLTAPAGRPALLAYLGDGRDGARGALSDRLADSSILAPALRSHIDHPESAIAAGGRVVEPTSIRMQDPQEVEPPPPPSRPRRPFGRALDFFLRPVPPSVANPPLNRRPPSRTPSRADAATATTAGRPAPVRAPG